MTDTHQRIAPVTPEEARKLIELALASIERHDWSQGLDALHRSLCAVRQIHINDPAVNAERARRRALGEADKLLRDEQIFQGAMKGEPPQVLADRWGIGVSTVREIIHRLAREVAKTDAEYAGIRRTLKKHASQRKAERNNSPQS
jgi:hypothetical protein